MKQAPGWLSAFPFLQAQWQQIKSITASYPEVLTYDLVQDWQCFLQNNQGLDWFSRLRLFRQSRLAYLAYHDMALPTTKHLSTMHQVTALADHLIATAYEVSTDELTSKHGVVVDEQGEQIDMMVFALGKLGTNELNYSSDVDLVFLYPGSGVSNGGRSIDAASYFSRLGKRIIQLLDHYTGLGRVYRVDMRLRPFGSAGPLVCSTNSLQQYLLHEGREWERFAWMRARMVCGSRSAGAAVMSEIQPFIYRKHLDYSVFSALAKIKSEIAQHLNHSVDDLKQGTGGIRAVEFIVQSLQMVFGGRNKRLQGTAISKQIQSLVEEKKLEPNKGRQLYEAWLWLRKIENLCQIVNDQDTHEVPDDSEVKQAISDCFGMSDWPSLEQALRAKRAHVVALFEQLFDDKRYVEQLNTNDQEKISELMAELPSGRMPQDTRERVRLLLEASMGLTDHSGLQRFIGLVKNLLTRPSYIMMLNKEPNVHKAVLELLNRHVYFVETLTQYPVLLEQLFDHQTHQMFNQQNLLTAWQLVKQEADVEQWMESLRYFKLFNQFNVIKAWSYEEITASQAQQQLTVLATFILRQVMYYSWHEIKEKMGSAGVAADQLIAIAYGSAAVEQMSVSSDLDLVFVVDTDKLNTDQRLFMQKWVRRLIHHLNTQLYHGKLYDLDLQLRPNGNSGALVTTRTEFEKYQNKEAWIWEHAAMIKSKALVGTEKQQQWHQNLRQGLLTQPRNETEVDDALQSMSDKLANTHGDKHHATEFVVLAAVLKHAHRHPELVNPAKIVDLHQLLQQLGLIDTTADVIQKDPAS